jgi:hypothetical protein
MSRDQQRPEHWGHVAGGALLAIAGAAELAAGARAGDRGRVRAGAAAAGLGWLAVRYGALYARVRRVEIATGAWRHLAPERPAQRPPAVRAAPSPPPGPPAGPPPWSWAPFVTEWPPSHRDGRAG